MGCVEPVSTCWPSADRGKNSIVAAMQHDVRHRGGRVDSLTVRLQEVAPAAEFSQAARGVQRWICGCHIRCVAISPG